MEKDFDFNRVGKRMPYKTPDGFFDDMEAHVWSEVKVHRKVSRRHIVVGTLSIAASIAFLIVMWLGHSESSATTSDNFAVVEQAFCNLSAEDQAYMLQVYQEDVFFDEEDGTI